MSREGNSRQGGGQRSGPGLEQQAETEQCSGGSEPTVIPETGESSRAMVLGAEGRPTEMPACAMPPTSPQDQPPLWQTPSASCSEAGATSRSGDRKGELLLGGQARQWATPKAEERQQQNSQDDYASLSKQVTNWPTPNQTDYKGASQPPGRRPECDDDLPSRVAASQPAPDSPQKVTVNCACGHQWESTDPVYLTELCPSCKRIQSGEVTFHYGPPAQESPSTPGKPRGSLNSAWVMQLMGWPEEYANALAEAATEYHLTVRPAGRTKAS